jgi:hypothetical protein
VLTLEGVMHGLYLVWWVQEKHVAAASVAVILAAGDLALTALEVPTGWLADRYGHRASLMLGSLLQVAGMLICWLGSGIPRSSRGERYRRSRRRVPVGRGSGAAVPIGGPARSGRRFSGHRSADARDSTGGSRRAGSGRRRDRAPVGVRRGLDRRDGSIGSACDKASATAALVLAGRMRRRRFPK